MTGLDIFALVVLVVLLATGLVGWALIGMYPGKIARERNHPQADAISVCGWWGALTLGILTPIAFIWAFTNPSGIQPVGCAETDRDGVTEEPAPEDAS